MHQTEYMEDEIINIFKLKQKNKQEQHKEFHDTVSIIYIEWMGLCVCVNSIWE